MLSDIKKSWLDLQKANTRTPHSEATKKIDEFARSILFCDLCCDGQFDTFSRAVTKGAEEEARLRGTSVDAVMIFPHAFYSNSIPVYFRSETYNPKMPILNQDDFLTCLGREGIIGTPQTIEDEVCEIPNDGSFFYAAIEKEVDAITQALGMENKVFARIAAHKKIEELNITKKTPIEPKLVYSCLQTEIVLALTGNKTGMSFAITGLINQAEMAKGLRKFQRQLRVMKEGAPHFKKFLDDIALRIGCSQLMSPLLPNDQGEDGQ